MESAQASRRIGFVTALLSVVCGPIQTRDVCFAQDDPRIEGFSDFTQFVFQVQGCLISLDEIVTAEIRRMDDDFTLSLRVAREGAAGVDSCLPWASAPGVDCVREELLAERLLTETEAATLQPAFSNLVVEVHAQVLCAVCGVVTFTWDDVVRHDSPCYTSSSTWRAASASIACLAACVAEARTATATASSMHSISIAAPASTSMGTAHRTSARPPPSAAATATTTARSISPTP